MDVAVALFVAVPLFVGGVFVLGAGAWMWSRALSQQHEANYSRVQAETAERAMEAIEEAGEPRSPSRAPFRPPTHDELRAAVLAEREAELEAAREYTTDTNDGIEPGPPIMSGGMYRA